MLGVVSSFVLCLGLEAVFGRSISASFLGLNQGLWYCLVDYCLCTCLGGVQPMVCSMVRIYRPRGSNVVPFWL